MEEQYGVGGWFPRTRIHLEEFYRFVEGDNLSFGEKTSKKCRESLKIKSIEYVRGNIDFLRIISEEVVFIYTEDGLFYVRGKSKAKILEYYKNSVLPTLGFIYSKGAPIPKLLADLSEKKPIVRHINPNSKVERVGQQELPNFHLFEYVIFFEEYRNFLDIALQMHRSIWSEIEEIRKKKTVQFKDLPKVRDALLDIKRNITFIKSRLRQLDGFMSTRERLSTYEVNDDLKKLHEYNYQTMSNSKMYFKELFEMTEAHANSTLDLVQMLYKENEQNEIRTLQMIFIIGAVASIIALGAMPGANITLTDAAGNIIQGTLSAFNWLDLLKYGVLTLVLGAVVYELLHFMFKRAKRFRLIHFAEGVTEKHDKDLETLKKIN